MTNGEKMQAVFPDIEMWGESKDTLDYSLGGMIHRVTKSWWNAEYKEPKIGHWIEIAQYSDGNHKIECSECESHIFDRGHANSFNVKNKYKYCPNCGARMVEPQERIGEE